MGFVNELVPEEDVEKYQLAEIDKRFVVGGTGSRQWTIDRDRNVYLRCVARGREDWRNQTEWTLGWHGALLPLRLDLIEGRGGANEPGWSHWRLIWLCGSSGLPEALKPCKNQILDALEAALVVYQGAGVYSASYTRYSVMLEIAEECVL